MKKWNCIGQDGELLGVVEALSDDESPEEAFKRAPGGTCKLEEQPEHAPKEFRG